MDKRKGTEGSEPTNRDFRAAELISPLAARAQQDDSTSTPIPGPQAPASVSKWSLPTNIPLVHNKMLCDT